MQDMREVWAYKGQQELSLEALQVVLWELELCLQSTILHYGAEYHQGLSQRRQEAFITWRKALEDMEASYHQHTSGCLNRLHLPTAEQAELTIYLSLLLPASVRTEVPSLDQSTFHSEPSLQMVLSVYPACTVSTLLSPVSGHIAPGPVQIVEDNPAMQWEVENQLCLYYMEAKICLMGILAPGEEVMCWLRATLDWQEEEAVNKWREEVLTEQPPSSRGDSPISLHSDQVGIPEPCTTVTESGQTVHPSTGITKSLVNPNEPIQGDKDDNNDKDEDG